MLRISGARFFAITTGRRSFGDLYIRRYLALVLCAITATAASVSISHAGEGGVSFWLPGQFGSLAAVPQAQPGWALTIVDYYTALSASGSVAAAREITIGNLKSAVNVSLNATLKAKADLAFVVPSYAFATPVFGGQLALSMTAIAGRNYADISGTLTASAGGIVGTRQGSIADGTTDIGDLYPQATLRWNSGVNNWMVYGMGDIPVGAYNSSSLSNIGIGHGAMDGGVGYTYFDQKTGHEFSVVTGLTYNLINPTTNYQNGVDWHLDWGASQFLSQQLAIGLVGYFYDQITGDSGVGDFVGPFESRVAAIGPQITYLFPVGNMQGYLNLKAYGEFGAHDRPDGWNAWLTFSISPGASSSQSTTPMVTKAPPH